MSKLLRVAGLLLLVGALVWLVTLWQWQTSGRDVSLTDIVVQLLLLPVLLVAVGWFAAWAVKRMREAPSARAGERTDASEASPTKTSSLHETLPQAWVVAQAVHAPGADDVGALWQILRRGEAVPTLDPELTDAQGLPIFSARGAESDPVADALAAHDEAGGATAWPPLPADGQPWSLGARRALWRLQPVLAHLLEALHQLPLVDDPTRTSQAGDGSAGFEPAPNHLSGVARPVTSAMVRAQSDRAPLLTVRLVLPATWREAERDGAVNWVREQAAEVLDWAQAQKAQGIRWVTESPSEPDELWSELDQLLVQWTREVRPQACLLLSCDSALDADRVAQWEARGTLFTAQHQRGRIPGEAAAGVLLVQHAWPGMEDSAQALTPVRLLSPLRTRRDKSADAVGRTGHQHLLALLQATQRIVLPDGGTEQLLLLTDADHRASRASELYEALQDAAPGLDPDTQVMRVGTVSGDLGQARPAMMLALAAAGLSQEPSFTTVWALMLHDAMDRAVLPVVRTWPPAAVSKPSAADAPADAVPA